MPMPYRQYNKHNTTLHARILFFLFFFYLIFPPSTALSLLFNPSSFLIIFLVLFFSHLFSYLFSHKTQKCNSHPHTTNRIMWLHQATEVNALMRQFNDAIQLIKHSCQIQLKIQSSIINCHTTNTVYVVH